jgi:RNA polymerase sigma-70 factor (ECF subfamily)
MGLRGYLPTTFERRETSTMNWTENERQGKQQKGNVVHNWGKITNNEPAVIEGKHVQLVENLQEKYGIFPKGKPFDEIFEVKIAQSIESLPGNFRSVVLLSDVEELRYTEIAKILACPVGTVCSRLHRGRKILQQKLSTIAANNGTIVRKFEDSGIPQKESFK